MILFWAVLFFFLVRLYKIERLNVETTVIEHQYRLYALRDKLREFAMAGKVNPKHWVFLYLDSSLAKTVDMLPIITGWWVWFMPFSYRKTKAFKRAHGFLKSELLKPSNAPFAEVHSEYSDLLGDFIFDRHPFFKWFKDIMPESRPPHIRKQWYRRLEFQTEAPKTSTLQEYAPAA